MSSQEKLNHRLIRELRAIAEEASRLAGDINVGPPKDPNNHQHPSGDPFILPRQRDLYWYYNTFGVIGLAYYICGIAKDEAERLSDPVQPGTKRKQPNDFGDFGCLQSWQTLIDDFELGEDARIYFYLSSMPPEVIPCLIRGDLPLQMQVNAFREKHRPYLNPRDTQGTYALFAAQAPASSSTQSDSNTHPGRGLSMKQLMAVITIMKDYVDIGSDTSWRARRIDSQFDNCPSDLDYAYQRRYASGADRDIFELQKKWLDYFEYIFLDWAIKASHANPTDPRLSEFMIRCLVYVGLAVSARARCRDHWDYKGRESPIFGLFTATLRFLYKEKYRVDKFTYQILRTVSNDDIGLDEIISASICSADPVHCGLDMVPCCMNSGSNADRSKPKRIQDLKDNARSIRDSGFQEENIEQSVDKITRVRKLLDFSKQEKREFLDLETQVAALRTVSQQLEQRIEKLRHSTLMTRSTTSSTHRPLMSTRS